MVVNDILIFVFWGCIVQCMEILELRIMNLCFLSVHCFHAPLPLLVVVLDVFGLVLPHDCFIRLSVTDSDGAGWLPLLGLVWISAC